MRDFFDMTRHERRGTIVLLVIIAVILLSTLAVRSCKTDVPTDAHEAALIQFESEIDSARVDDTTAVPQRPRHAKRKVRKKKQPTRSSGTSPQPRRVDPVPSF